MSPSRSLLRVGYGGVMGPLANTDQEGFASAAFHAFPEMLRFDAISGDYAQSLLGHALHTGAYLVSHAEFGWQAFGGRVDTSGPRVGLVPLDAFRARVYLAPAGLWLTLDAGQFERVEMTRDGRTVRVGLARATSSTPVARLRLEQPAAAHQARCAVSSGYAQERGAWVIPLSSSTTWVTLTSALAEGEAPVR